MKGKKIPQSTQAETYSTVQRISSSIGTTLANHIGKMNVVMGHNVVASQQSHRWLGDIDGGEDDARARNYTTNQNPNQEK